MNAMPIKLLALMLAISQTVGFAEDSATEPAVGLKFAARMERLLASMNETVYQHTTAIDERNGSIKCDCSGLVGYVLRQEFPEAYVSLRGQESPWRTRPLSVTYYETFMAAAANSNPVGAWQRVIRLMDVEPGDILAWRKKTIERGSTTGHTCMVASRPELQPDGTVRVRLIDSTRSPHANDTRPAGTTGFGAGLKSFLINDDGEPIGYLSGERRVKVSIAVGRLKALRSIANDPRIAKTEDSSFVGMTAAAAEKLAEMRQLETRIIRQDGKPQAVKMRVINDRLNFVIEDGRVIEVIRG